MRRGRCPRRSARRCGRPGAAPAIRPRRGIPGPPGDRTRGPPGHPAAPRSPARAYRACRGCRPWAATAPLIGRPSPAAKSRLQPPYRGILSRAPQIASVANSHVPARSETRPERSQFTAANTIPGITNRTTCPTGTVQGKSLPLRKYLGSDEVVFLEEHEHKIEITSGEAERDRQQDRVRRRKKDSARRPLSPSFGQGGVHRVTKVAVDGVQISTMAAITAALVDLRRRRQPRRGPSRGPRSARRRRSSPRPCRPPVGSFAARSFRGPTGVPNERGMAGQIDRGAPPRSAMRQIPRSTRP